MLTPAQSGTCSPLQAQVVLQLQVTTLLAEVEGPLVVSRHSPEVLHPPVDGSRGSHMTMRDCRGRGGMC